MSSCKSAATGKDKIAYWTEAAAQAARAETQEALKVRGDTEWQLLNAYECNTCGCWHVGRNKFKRATVHVPATPRWVKFNPLRLPPETAAVQNPAAQPTKTSTDGSRVPLPERYEEHTAAQACVQAVRLFGWAVKTTAVAVLRKTSERVSKLADEIESQRERNHR